MVGSVSEELFPGGKHLRRRGVRCRNWLCASRWLSGAWFPVGCMFPLYELNICHAGTEAASTLNRPLGFTGKYSAWGQFRHCWETRGRLAQASYVRSFVAPVLCPQLWSLNVSLTCWMKMAMRRWTWKNSSKALTCFVVGTTSSFFGFFSSCKFRLPCTPSSEKAKAVHGY